MSNTEWLEYAFNRLNQIGFELGSNFQFEDETEQKKALPLVRKSDLQIPDPHTLIQNIDQLVTNEQLRFLVHRQRIYDQRNDSLDSNREFRVDVSDRNFIHNILGTMYEFEFERGAYTPGFGGFDYSVNPNLGIYVVNAIYFRRYRHLPLGTDLAIGVELGEDFVYGGGMHKPRLWSKDRGKANNQSEQFVQYIFYLDNPKRVVDYIVKLIDTDLKTDIKFK